VPKPRGPCSELNHHEDARTRNPDVATGKWTTGPALPGDDRVAFLPAAGTVGRRLVVNTSEGPIYRLNESGNG
jgi:hypothetical protein